MTENPKKQYLKEMIEKLQTELKLSLVKKSHGKKELSISEYHSKIAKLQKEYESL